MYVHTYKVPLRDIVGSEIPGVSQVEKGEHRRPYVFSQFVKLGLCFGTLLVNVPVWLSVSPSVRMPYIFEVILVRCNDRYIYI